MQGRKALIILSDGVDQGSKVSLTRAIEAAQRSDTLVYTILFADPQAYNNNQAGGQQGGGSRRRWLPRRWLSGRRLSRRRSAWRGLSRAAATPVAVAAEGAAADRSRAATPMASRS